MAKARKRRAPHVEKPRAVVDEWHAGVDWRFGLFGVVVLAAGMLWWCWGRSPDVIVDYGREVYVPWRLAEGEVLYRDIAYFNGPFSPYWNAGWFAIAGTSVRTLALVNAGVVAIALGLLFDLMKAMSSRWTAVLGLAVFVLAFAFGHYADIGNYNFIYPYSHEMTHGTVLSLASIWCFMRWLRRPRVGWAAGSGLLAGLVFLGKPEIFLALAGALAAGLIATSTWQRDRRVLGTLWLGVLGGAIVPPIVSLLLLWLSMPLGEAARSMTQALVGLTNRELVLHPFYRKVMGNWDTSASLWGIARWTAIYLAVFVPLTWLGRLMSRDWRSTVAASLTAAVVVGGLAVYFADPLWRDALYPLPAFMVVLGLLSAWELARGWKNDPESMLAMREDGTRDAEGFAPAVDLTLKLTWITFSLLMLLKIVLRVRVQHYGFALALPAALTLVMALVDWLPRAIARRGGNPHLVRAAALAAIAIFLGQCLQIDRFQYATKTVPIAAGGDRIFGEGNRGRAMQAAIENIERLTGPDDTLVVLPEGVTLNYFARRVNPTPFINFMPAEMILFGEARMLEAFEAHPPDYVALVPNNLSEMGYKAFMHDYAMQLAAWVERHYQVVVPADPANQYGILVLQRKTANDVEQSSGK